MTTAFCVALLLWHVDGSTYGKLIAYTAKVGSLSAENRHSDEPVCPLYSH